MPTIIGSSETRIGSGRVASRKGTPVFEESYAFIVEADSKTQTRAEILFTTPGLPQVNSTTGPFGLTVCRGAKADRRTDNALIWDVVCDFSSEIEQGTSGTGSGGFNPSDDPVAWVPVYETKFERYQEVVTKDLSGAAIANSAGQAFETGLTITRHIPIWEFWQFEPATTTDEDVIARSETVNSTTFKGRAAKTLLCVVLSSAVGFYYGQARRLTQYQLKYNSRDWRHKRLDVGTQYKSGTTLLDFTSSDGSIMLGSLNGSGGKQAAGTGPAIMTFDQYATNTFSFIRI